MDGTTTQKISKEIDYLFISLKDLSIHLERWEGYRRESPQLTPTPYRAWRAMRGSIS